jgi:hypothetical protein
MLLVGLHPIQQVVEALHHEVVLVANRHERTERRPVLLYLV